MATHIERIRGGEKIYPVEKLSEITSVRIDSPEEVVVEGNVSTTARATVTCTVTRHYRAGEPRVPAWTQTVLGLIDKNGDWSLKLGRLSPGAYLVSLGVRDEGIDCIEIDVAGEDKRNVINVSACDSSPNLITVHGTVQHQNAQVTCTLTPPPGSGQPGSNSTAASNGNPPMWSISFVPSNVAQDSFSGTYSVSASSNPPEGSVMDHCTV